MCCKIPLIGKKGGKDETTVKVLNFASDPHDAMHAVAEQGISCIRQKWIFLNNLFPPTFLAYELCALIYGDLKSEVIVVTFKDHRCCTTVLNGFVFAAVL